MSHQWNGREVTFVEFNLKIGREVRQAFAEDAERGTYTTLIHSARYADDGSPVFRTLDEIEALPYRLLQKVMRLATAAADANKVEEVEVVDEAGQPVPLH